MEYCEELLMLIKDTWDESNPTRERAIKSLTEYGETMWEQGYEACQEEHI